MTKRPTLTTSVGAPIGDNQNSVTAEQHGPVLLQDYPLIETLAHQNRERITERTVRANGWGAPQHINGHLRHHQICKAKTFSEVGKIRMLGCFSAVAGE